LPRSWASDSSPQQTHKGILYDDEAVSIVRWLDFFIFALL